MKNNIIFLLILTLSFFLRKETIAQNKKEGFFNDSTWSTLTPSALSVDGEWAVFGTKNNNNPKVNNIYFINTTTKEKKEFTHLSGFYQSLLNNGLVVGNIKNDLAIYSLNQNDSLIIKDITKFDTSKDLDLLFYINQNNELLITKLNKTLSKNKIELLIKGVQKYYLSPDSNKIVALSKHNELIHIDLKKFTFKKVFKIDSSISDFKWNTNQDGIVIRSNKKLNIVDLTSYKIKEIEIKESKDIENFKLSFFFNNDLYFSYQYNSDEIIPEGEYLDVWQANSKSLATSNSKIKYKKIYKAFAYHKDKLIELERHIDKDYLNIGIPGYLLSYNNFKDIDFKSYFHPIEYSLYDIEKKKNILVLSSVGQKPFYPSKDGKYLLYPANYTKNKWEILDIVSKEKHSFNIDISNTKRITPTWSHDSKKILYASDGNLYSYTIKNKKIKKLTNFNLKGDDIIDKIVGSESTNSFTKYLDTTKPFYFISNQDKKSTLYVYDKQKLDSIYTTSNRLSFKNTVNNTYSTDLKTILFTTEDYNLPPKILSIQNKKVSTIIESDIDKNLYQWRKRVNFTFTDKFNKELKGYLFYPKNYDPNKKYPMVVQIYDLDLLAPIDMFSTPVHVASHSGFNTSLLAENDYFVLRAQTYVTEEGPGVAAVDCVTNAVNKSLEIEPSIDKDNLGLIGHSFGGYKTAAVSVLSNMFKASVSSAGFHDLIGGVMFRYSNYRMMPDWFMAERSQSNMGVKFSEDPEKYYNNSPLLHAYKTKTAMLLVTGLQDENVHWENTQKMFLALKREQKPVIALFYKNIIHGITSTTPIENYDLSVRVLDWFNYHLKDKKQIKWIHDGIDYNTYSLSPL
ncbi:S9 family peptidase [Myroides odoratimimus]|uniref:S9 family peptidase n=1 Tax=Myroides odoratimimus TaxID=76832 RepID=UPI001CE13C99|nr:prolyl oligopeptidase family serine peptidase [Myroides odoratimimus]MCA4807005.1 prolyl oligopeptidase family serine peptidase [Myroides odoratimimus]